MRPFSSARANADRRAQPRDAVQCRAKVLDRHFALDATIRDISAAGARLAFSGGRTPSADTFIIVDLGGALGHEARVIWRKGEECGVRIIKTQDLRGLVPGQFDAAKRIWQATAR